jgi:hypothetical protein
LAGVLVNVRESSSQQIIQSSTSAEDGLFSFQVPATVATSYDIDASLDGYISRTIRVTVSTTDPESTTPYNLLLSPVIITADTYRFVLEWGARPRDLDSHLIMVDTDCEVKWSRKNCITGQTKGLLDIDNTQGFGPETTTLEGAKGVAGRTSGTSSMAYYVVKQFGGFGSLATSNATVTVYSESGLMKVLKVPQCNGIKWNVASVDMTTGQITYNEDRLGSETDPCMVPFVPGNGGGDSGDGGGGGGTGGGGGESGDKDNNVLNNAFRLTSVVGAVVGPFLAVCLTWI